MCNFKTLCFYYCFSVNWVFLTFPVHSKSNLNQKCLLWGFFLQLFCIYRTSSVCGDWSSLGKSYSIENCMVFNPYLPKITTIIFHCNFSSSVKQELKMLFWNADVSQTASKFCTKARGKWMENWMQVSHMIPWSQKLLKEDVPTKLRAWN